MESTNRGGAARCQHAEAKVDPIVRAETCFFIGNQIIREIDCYLALYNCQFCGSTIAVPLPGHVEDEPDGFEVDTVVGVAALPACRRREAAGDVSERDGFVAAEVAA